VPYKDKKDRDYRAEYENYDGRPDVKKKRALRNAARRTMEKAGKVKKGDGKDVDHVVELSRGGTNNKGNLKAVPASANRSFKRNKDHSRK
jgi:hypothetical protein